MTPHRCSIRTGRAGMFFSLLALPAVLLLIAAADRPAPRIAIVDADRIRLESRYVQRRLTEIANPAEQIKQQMIDRQQALKDAVEAYQAQASAMSEAARQDRAARIQQLRAETEALSRNFDAAMNKAGGQDLEFVRLQIMDTVGALAGERNLDAVFSSANVLYTAPQVDLTDEIIHRLDDSTP
jgi:Skp family chaperone for outer membrane proteins